MSEINVAEKGLEMSTETPRGQLVGYARVSTADQNLDLQADALREAGCAQVFEDKASGTKEDRPQLAACLAYLRAGDTLVIWKLDRLARSTQHLLKLSKELADRHVELRILTMGIDTGTPAGKLIYTILAGLAEFERDLILERTHAGLAAARARGRVGGRKPKMTAKKLEVAKEMYASKRHTVAQIAEAIGVSRATVYRHLEGTPA